MSRLVKIENQYQNNAPESIWNVLNIDQRNHFVHDHDLAKDDELLPVHLPFSELPQNIKEAFADHVNHGQYRYGGMVRKDYASGGNKFRITFKTRSGEKKSKIVYEHSLQSAKESIRDQYPGCTILSHEKLMANGGPTNDFETEDGKARITVETPTKTFYVLATKGPSGYTLEKESGNPWAVNQKYGKTAYPDLNQAIDELSREYGKAYISDNIYMKNGGKTPNDIAIEELVHENTTEGFAENQINDIIKILTPIQDNLTGKATLIDSGGWFFHAAFQLKDNRWIFFHAQTDDVTISEPFESVDQVVDAFFDNEGESVNSNVLGQMHELAENGIYITIPNNGREELLGKYYDMALSGPNNFEEFESFIKTNRLESPHLSDILRKSNNKQHFIKKIMEFENPSIKKDGGNVNDSILEFTIPTWAVPALINGDYSGLEDEDEEKLNKFVEKTVAKYGNALFMLGDKSEETEFHYRNDIDGTLGGDVTTLYLLPTINTNPNAFIDKENAYHEEVREWVYANAPKEYHNWSLDDIPYSVFTPTQQKQRDDLLYRFYTGNFKNGGQIEGNAIVMVDNVLLGRVLGVSRKTNAGHIDYSVQFYDPERFADVSENRIKYLGNSVTFTNPSSANIGRQIAVLSDSRKALTKDITLFFAEKDYGTHKASIGHIISKKDADDLGKSGYKITSVHVPAGYIASKYTNSDKIELQKSYFKNGGPMEATATVSNYLSGLNMAALPDNLKSYINDTLIPDPDIDLIPLSDPKIVMMQKLITDKYPAALQPPAEAGEMTRQDLIDAIEGLKLIADDDPDAADAIAGLELLLEDMPEKKNDGGGVDNYHKTGDNNRKLVNFDLTDLDTYEETIYKEYNKSMSKAQALQMIINSVEGDYSQLSAKLAEIAEEQYPSDEYAKGGPINSTDDVYIDFLNKKKNFKQDRKYFKDYDEAVAWAKKNLEKFNPDMIKYLENGGTVTEDNKKAVTFYPFQKRKNYKPGDQVVINIEDEWHPAVVKEVLKGKDKGTFTFEDNPFPRHWSEIHPAKFDKGGMICPYGTKLQSLLFDKDKFSKGEARKWARKNKKKGNALEETENKWRLRQRDPETFQKDTFATIRLTDGVQAIIACPKK